MASLFSFNPPRRPCYVDGKKALFHMWGNFSEIVCPSILNGGHPGGVVASVLGIVEFEDGNVMKVYPEKITFINDGEFELWWAWPEKSKGEN